jgi:hypothetical protein
MIADSQREIDLAHGVGRKVETVDKPAGDKEAQCQAARREAPTTIRLGPNVRRR